MDPSGRPIVASGWANSSRWGTRCRWCDPPGFAISAGHGEFPRAVIAPGTIEQSYELTRRAVATAHKFQTPVIVLTDQFLQDLQKNINPLDDRAGPVDTHVVDAGGGQYLRYAVTAGGVSRRAIPGGEALVVCDSDEHTADGHISEDLDVHLAQHDKRMAKLLGMIEEALPPALYGREDAEILLVCWGSTYGPCREAVDRLNEAGARAAMLHFAQVWPINPEAARPFLEGRSSLICVEGNSTGQFASVLRQVGLIGPCDLLLRYDGLPFTAEYIVSRVRQ